MIKLTKRTLRSWRVNADIYRWFLSHFPDGGDYAQVHSALISAGRIDWANSLLEYAYSLWSEQSEFIAQEGCATQGIVDFLFHRRHNNQTASDQAAASYLLNRQPCAQLSCPTDFGELSSDGYCSKISNAGMNNLIASSGDHSWIGSAGYASQIASVGEAARVAVAGQHSRIGSSGARAKIASAGNACKISSSGAAARIAASGMRGRIGAIGERSKIANAGDLCKISAFGHDALIANVGGDTGIIASGDNSVVASAGVITYVVLGKGGCAAIPYDDGKRTRFAVAYEGENGIQAGVKYTLNEAHQFVEYLPQRENA
jgi:hypothetical protein